MQQQSALFTAAPTQNLDKNSEEWREGSGEYLRWYYRHFPGARTAASGEYLRWYYQHFPGARTAAIHLKVSSLGK